MPSSLPYESYTWHFPQHDPGLTSRTLYTLLQCAATYEGHTRVGDKITNLIIATGILTPNPRDGKFSAWRDYQQILATLGLIYSTRARNNLTLTDLGRMYLAEEISFQDLMTVQALRFQYPNGQNYQLPPKARPLAASLAEPIETLPELQSRYGVLVKPPVLILRVLIELLSAGHEPELTTDECQAFLLPCTKNDQWHQAMAEITKARKRRSATGLKVNRHARRNIQDWFRFLAKTKFFKLSERGLSLTADAISYIAEVHAVCSAEEDLSAFWVPINSGGDIQNSWFRWYGSIPIRSTDLDKLYGPQLLNQNEGESFPELESEVREGAEICLTNVDLDALMAPIFNSTDLQDKQKLLDAIEQGKLKRSAMSQLHNLMVACLARRFQSQGAEVSEDPNSVDLFVRWPAGETAIFEVKTITNKNRQRHMRLAIGQIEEYAYRLSKQTDLCPDKVIALSCQLTGGEWEREFITEHLGLGLIASPHTIYSAFDGNRLKSYSNWRV